MGWSFITASLDLPHAACVPRSRRESVGRPFTGVCFAERAESISHRLRENQLWLDGKGFFSLLFLPCIYFKAWPSNERALAKCQCPTALGVKEGSGRARLTLALGSLGEQIPFCKKEAREFSQCRRQQVIYNVFAIRGHGEGPGAEFQERHRIQLSL